MVGDAAGLNPEFLTVTIPDSAGETLTGIGVGAVRTRALSSASRCVEGVVDLVRES